MGAFLKGLKYIPLSNWLVIAGLVLMAFLTIWLFRRRVRSRKGAAFIERRSPAQRLGKAVVYGLRLAGFAVLAFIFVGGGLLIYLDYQQVMEEMRPAPSRVEIPPDLPFDVEEVRFEGGDGLMMAGWFVPPRNGAMVILLHGYSGNRLAMRWHAERLVEVGFGVLMYDERASGESEGTQRSYGWDDPDDVGGALAYLSRRSEVDSQHIGIAGCSIGAQIALQSAVRYPQLQAVWADGASSVRAKDLPPPENWALGIASVSNYLLDWMYIWKTGDQAPALIDTLSSIAPRPIMLVAGGAARPYFGSEAPRAQRLAHFAGANALVWIIEDAYHCDGPNVQPEEYAGRMVSFFEQGLGVTNRR